LDIILIWIKSTVGFLLGVAENRIKRIFQLLISVHFNDAKL